MPRVRCVTCIRAAPEICFDLARDVEFHLRCMSRTGEQAVAGKTTGFLDPGDEVTFRARHLGVWHSHAARITAFERPGHFRDEMTAGRFRSFVHDHYFEPDGSGTQMIDVVEFELPFGLLGSVVGTLFLSRYLKRLLEARGQEIKREAEQLVAGLLPPAGP